MSILRVFMHSCALKARPISVWHLAAVYVIIICYRWYNIPTELYEFNDLIKLSKGASCRIPRLDPWDSSIMKYISKPSPVVCKVVQPPIYTIVDSALVYNETAASIANLKRGDLSCQYRCFYHDTGNSDLTVKYGEWIDLPEETSPTLQCEFVEINCVKKNRMRSAVSNFCLAHIVPKKSKQVKPKETKQLSVFIMGIDSMSYSNVKRQLPKTLDFFEKELGGISFEGHTKVGDNTWVNLISILTGKIVESTRQFTAELNSSCGNNYCYSQFFDNWAHYIWKNYSDAGYETMFIEDRPDITLFNYEPKQGFKYPPVDHYFRPFWIAAYWSLLKMKSSAFCYNTVPEHMLHLNYMEDFLVKRDPQRPYWIFNWLQGQAHDYLNAIGASDDDIASFFARIKPRLNDTIVIFVSDHGNRYDAIRQSVIGRIETRMPYLGIALPRWLKRKHPHLVTTLKANAKLLTSQFDIYATMGDILHGRFDADEIANFKDPSHHGTSLFKPIPPGRQCLDAMVPDEYCPCYAEIALPVDQAKVVEAAKFMLDHLNKLLEEHIVSKTCAKLSLHHIVDAHVFVPRQEMIHDPQVGSERPRSGFYVSYRIQLVASPNAALLEGVIKRSVDQSKQWIDGDVDRNNAYGNTSICIAEHQMLKKYCYCL